MKKINIVRFLEPHEIIEVGDYLQTEGGLFIGPLSEDKSFNLIGLTVESQKETGRSFARIVQTLSLPKADYAIVDA